MARHPGQRRPRGRPRSSLPLLDLLGQRLLQRRRPWRRPSPACGSAARRRGPALAATSAMPDPMIPDPTMPRRSIAMAARGYRPVTVEPAWSNARRPTGATAGRYVGAMPGPLALVGGGEFTDGCAFDARPARRQRRRRGASSLPTGAAYEHPERLVERGRALVRRRSAPPAPGPRRARPPRRPRRRQRRRRARRPLRLPGRRARRCTCARCSRTRPLWDALVAAWHGRRRARRLGGRRHGAAATRWSTPGAAPSPSASGSSRHLAVMPHADTWSEDKLHRTQQLAPPACRSSASTSAPPCSATPTARGASAGVGEVSVWRRRRAGRPRAPCPA